MATTKAIDVSRHQGTIDWKRVKAAGYQIALVKMTGGDDGLYTDSKAYANYKGAKAAGLAVGMYHFAGKNSAIAEADKFIGACSPIAENDVLVLDWEWGKPSSTADQWCADFINRVKSKLKVTPMIYMNTSSENYISWTKTRATNAGLWVADYRSAYKPPNKPPIKHWPFFFIHQYSSSGSVPGISGNVDLNVVYGTVSTFNKYGYHKAVAPVVTTKTVTEQIAIPYTTVERQDATLTLGKRVVSVQGKSGLRTKTYTVTYTDGKETKRVLVSDKVTTSPTTEVILVGTYVAPVVVNPDDSTVDVPTQTPQTPESASKGLKTAIIAVIAAVAAAIAALVAWLHS
jgi:GH25 family lysozyme M1 (1,4-beta-N-acetylmuramidase)